MKLAILFFSDIIFSFKADLFYFDEKFLGVWSNLSFTSCLYNFLNKFPIFPFLNYS